MKRHVRRSAETGRPRRRHLVRVAQAVAPLALLVTVTAVTTNPVSATSVTSLAVTAHPETPGVAASYPISFTPANNLNYASTISVVAAPGTTFSPCSSSCANYTIAQGGAYKNYSKVAVQAGPGSGTTNAFVITIAMNMVNAGTPVTIVAQGLNPATAGTDSLSLWTSNNTSPVSAPYTIGTPGFGLVQGAMPNHTEAPQFDLSSPAYLQTMFGTPTQTMPTLAMAYLPSSDWTQMDGATGSLGYLQQDGWSTPSGQPTPGYQLIIGVPIVPSSNKGSVTLESGANGAYDQYFRQLAVTLINEGLGNAWLRLGYEFDNQGLAKNHKPWGTSNSTTQEGYFAEYFRQIVTTMRAVPGSNFRYVWNPDGFAFLGNNDPEYTNGGFSLLPAWPGSQYVDFIGADVYDQQPSMTSGYTQAQNWANFIDPQLQAAAQFASSEGVPLTFPEWGVMAPEAQFAGMGDDPGYINGMYCFMTNPADHVAWESYINANYAGWNTAITDGNFPASLAAFQQDFGHGSTAACSSG